MNNATPIELATQELPAAVAAIGGGDESATRYAGEIQRLVGHVLNTSAVALRTAQQLHADDVMNPQGKARKLAEIPAGLIAATSEQVSRAELDLEVIEGIHLEGILRHDGRNDANLRAELDNYVAGIKPETATATLVGLAADARYSTYLAGPMGKSLAFRFGLDPGIFRKVALESLAVDGTEDQRRRSRSLASIEQMRRVIGLARGGRDLAAEEVRRPPKPVPSQALFS